MNDDAHQQYQYLRLWLLWHGLGSEQRVGLEHRGHRVAQVQPCLACDCGHTVVCAQDMVEHWLTVWEHLRLELALFLASL